MIETELVNLNKENWSFELVNLYRDVVALHQTT